MLPVQVFSSDFYKNFQKRFRSPNGTLESLKVYDPHIWSRNMTIFFLSLRLICGVYESENVCIPWLPVLLSRRVIQDRVGTFPNPGLMEHGVFGGYVKASRPLIRVLVINDNGLWINDFILDNEYRLIHG